MNNSCFPYGLVVSMYDVNSPVFEADKILKYPKTTSAVKIITAIQSN